MIKILEKVKVFARRRSRRRRRRQGFHNTPTFSSKTAELKITFSILRSRKNATDHPENLPRVTS